MEFREKLIALRKQSGLSQRQLANKIGVNFSYLSKIESGKMPPPSEQVIIRLAEVLDADKDELMTLAGRIPSDIAQILKNREALEILRSNRTQKKIMDNNRKAGGGTMKKLFSYKTLSKIAVPIVLVCAVAASLWYVAPQPVKALDITITPPSSGTLGSSHSFTATISIDVAKVLPIQTIDMEIYNVSNPTGYVVNCTDLPKTDGSSRSYSTSGGVVTVTASSPTLFEYFSGAGYANWQGVGYDFGTTFGYGYSTTGGPGTLTYSIAWTSPAGWPSGAYKIKLSIAASSPTLSETFIQTSSSFILETPAADTGASSGAVVVSTGTVNVANVITRQGIFTNEVTVESGNKQVSLAITKNTVGKQSSGQALHTISVTPMTTPPAPPANTNIIGITYDMKPDGATFNPPITGTFSYDPSKVTDLDNLVVAMWNADTGEWITLENCVVDPVTNTISAPISHFTVFSVIESIPVEVEVPEETPAAFTISNLSITPAGVKIGESVSISVKVANTGDLSGSYDVSLKINGAVVDTKSVTVAGGASETVTFTTTQSTVGTYTVAVNTLSGSFTVSEEAAPTPAAFTISNLSVSPAEVNVGESVTISVRVSNTGELSGSYDVSLKINGIEIETKSVTVSGGASQTVTFTTTQDIAGTYSVEVNTLSGSFSVSELPSAGIAWWIWLIIGIVVVAVILVGYFMWWRRR